MARVSPPDQLVSFLKGFKCTPEDKKEKRLTHTWFGDYVCTYNIPSDRYPELYDLIYESAFVKKNSVHLIERFTNPSIMKVDLDFEFKIDTRSRIYTDQHLKDIIKLYNKLLHENLDISKDQINCYVFERNRGYRDKGKYKDGLHLMWPDIKISIPIQKFIRDQFLKLGYSIFDTLSLTNKKLGDVVDESIIGQNGWMMYGSTKPAREPYLLTRVYDFHVESQTVPTDNRRLIEYFSLYNPDKDVYEIKEDRKELLNEFTKPKQPQLGGNGKGKLGGVHRVQVGQRRVKSNNFGEDLTTVKKLVGLLSDYRAYDHKQWIEVGLCLYNIDDMLLDTWIDFSKRIKNKFVPGECEEKWTTFKHKSDAGSLGIGSLRYWAQLDDPVGYEEIQRGSLTNILNESADGTTYTVAKVVYEMYKYQFVCTSLRHKTWYEYKGHKWHEIENGLSLSMKLSNEVLNEYLKMNQSYLSRAYMMDGAKKQPYINNTKKFLDVALKLQDITYKEKIMKECSGLFYDSKFVEKLDTKANLICFENGVYDLDTKDFRDGRPEDYCSLSTMTDYTEFDKDSEEAKEIDTFMSQVFPIPRVKEYVYTLLSSFLLGKNPNEKFHVWTGCHAKDTQIMMANGKLKKVQDINEGEFLMGDDSTPRMVKKLVRGVDDMYEIIPTKGPSYVVNKEHILCLQATKIGSIAWIEKEKRYKSTWHGKDENGYPKLKGKTFPIRYEGKKIYRSGVTYYDTKDDAYEAAIQHKIGLQSTKDYINDGDVIEIPVNEWLKRKSYMKKNYFGYRVPVDYSTKKVNLDPYMLGYWLGDGASKQTSITTMDSEVIEYFIEKTRDLDLVCKKYTKKDNKASTYYFSSGTKFGKGNRNALLNKLKQYDLFGYKHIPDDFKFNAEDIRKEVLAGIIDSDGHYNPTSNQYEITLKLENLIDDIITICRSLGFACYKSEVKKTCPKKDGTTFTGTYYQVCIVGDGIETIPVLLNRKIAKERGQKKNPLRYGIDIKSLEKQDDYYGFQVDKNHRYLLSDFSVTHNCGGNGKSKLIELFKLAFGEYAGNLPVSLLTQKRGASSSASPELARCRGKRFVDMPEPDRGNRINIGLMKELTGGDKILARQLYKEPFEFKPMFKIVLCCNDLPKVPPDDEGTWRRLRVVKFISKFTSKPKGEYQYPVDPYLADNFERWKEPFMYMLLQYHEHYRNEGIKEPAEVLQATKDYQRMADIYVDFLDENVVKGDDNMIIKLEDFFARYKSWYTQNYGSTGVHNMKTFRSNIERKLGNYNMFGGWQGIKFRAPQDVFNEDGEPNQEQREPEEKLDLDKMPGTNRMAIEDALLPQPTKDDVIDEKQTKINHREPKTHTITKDENNPQKFRMRVSSRSSSRSVSRATSRKISRKISRPVEDIDMDQVIDDIADDESTMVIGPSGNKLKIPLCKK